MGSEKANGTGLVLASIDLRAVQEFACDGKVIGLRLPGGREYFLSAASDAKALQWVDVMRGRVLEGELLRVWMCVGVVPAASQPCCAML